jgi:D-alanine-D-alanine ligase
MGDRVLDVIDIVPSESLKFYNYEAKYAPGGSVHVLPARLSSIIYQSVQTFTEKAYRALGCRGVARADFRLDERDDGTFELACLEVNTQPGMTGTSLVPELAAHVGIPFGKLVAWMVEDASTNR